MKPDYKNWMPSGLIVATAALAAALAAAAAVPALGPVPRVLAAALAAAFALAALWMLLLHRAFSYRGKRQMARQIIEGVARFVDIPDGGRALDVGCGSGALAIACAKRNPAASVVGVDRWGKEYASFSKALCERNAAAEGAPNVSFQRGDAKNLPFPDASFDAVASNYVYHNIPAKNRQDLLLETLRVLKKGGVFAIHDIMSPARYGDVHAFADRLKSMGFEDVRLVDTADGLFMSRREAAWMALRGSTLLVGRK